MNDENKKKTKIFISIKMSGRSEEDIKNDMKFIMKNYFPSCELIDSFCETEEDSAVKYLGKSIYALGNADAAVFVPGWKEARGCIIENMVCQMYDIPVVYLKDDWRNLAKVI